MWPEGKDALRARERLWSREMRSVLGASGAHSLLWNTIVPERMPSSCFGWEEGYLLLNRKNGMKSTTCRVISLQPGASGAWRGSLQARSSLQQHEQSCAGAGSGTLLGGGASGSQGLPGPRSSSLMSAIRDAHLFFVPWQLGEGLHQG